MAASKVLYRIPIAGGDPEPWLTLPIEDNLFECSMSVDARLVVCTAGGDSDIWMIDDFDQLLPR